MATNTNSNSKGSGNDAQENSSLVRQSSVYSLTFDEFQTTLGKEFGSMNMEELLKSIWSAEETQNTSFSAPHSQDGGGNQGGFLQRQGSLSLPRTLSLKTVDEVWKGIAKDFKDSGSEVGVPKAETQREPTLGEITLEEFLVRAGVVREESDGNGSMGFGVGDGISFQQPNHGDDKSSVLPVNGSGSMGFGVEDGIGFQQPKHGGGLSASRVADDKLSVLPLNVNGVRSTPKRSPVSCAPSMAVPKSTQLASPGIWCGITGLLDQKINGKLGYCSVLHGAVDVESPDSLSSDGMYSDGDTVSPVPFMFGGRKSSCAMETAIERRQRRMVMNRESAARSRARREAYAMELEEELAKLKEENKKLKELQEAKIEMERNQVSEEMEERGGLKKRRLLKTLSAPAP